MRITKEYLIEKGFGTSNDNGHAFYKKNDFIVSQNVLGRWEQYHDFGTAGGFGGDSLIFENTEELEQKYLEDVGCSIDE